MLPPSIALFRTHKKRRIAMKNSKKIRVEYTETLVHCERETGSWGPWSKEFDSEITQVAVDGGSQSRYGSDCFLVSADADTVYTVYITYSDGDSFGRARGRIAIILCTSDEGIAEYLAARLSGEDRNSYTIDIVDEFGREVKIGNPGSGYFEEITNVEILKTVL